MPDPIKDANIVNYGLRNCTIWPLDEAEYQATGLLTYGDPIDLPGDISLNLAPQGNDQANFGSDVDYWHSYARTAFNGQLVTYKFNDEFRKAVYGDVIEEDGGVYDNVDVVPHRFALAFERQGDANGVRYVFYNCTATIPELSAETKQDSVTPAQETVTVNAVPVVMNKAGKMGTNYKLPGSTTATSKYDNWFKTVQKPADLIERETEITEAQDTGA